LVLNGLTVGASLSTDDTYSYASNSGSAIAKAAAINRITSTSNIKAEVGTTQVTGSAMSSAGTGTAGTITINGTAISITLASTNDYATNRAAVVAAINLNTGTTGVTATDNLSTTNGVSLKAADGRNITVAFDGANLTASNTGVAAAGTYAGTYTLRSLSQGSIVVSSNVGGTLANADLGLGTFSSNTAQFINKARSGSIAAPTALSAGDLMINGYNIGAAFTSDDTASIATTTSSTKAASAISMAAAINRQTTLTKVSATVNPNVVEGTGFSAGAVDTIYLNGVSIAASLSTSSTAADVVTLLNTYTGQTGVTAANNGSGVTLTASDGRNIAIGVSSGGAAVAGTRIGLGGNAALSGAAASSAGAMTYLSSVKLTSTNGTFTIAPGSNGTANFSTLGFREGTFGGGSTSTKVSSLDISTTTGGTNALTTLADAINMVSQYQATVGALQNRMSYQTSYVNNLKTTSTAAYGNIVNYDLAAETAALATAKIKQNASMAMLAQANISQDMVSYLLKQYIK
jgi:flagellin